MIDKFELRLSGRIRRAERSRNNAFCVSDSWQRLITSLGAWQHCSPLRDLFQVSQLINKINARCGADLNVNELK